MLKQSLSLALVLAAGSAVAEEAKPSFSLAPIQSEAAVSSLRELDPVGLGHQPAWTAGTPRFTFSDVYTVATGVRVVGVSAATDFGFRHHDNTHVEVAEHAAVGLKYGWEVGVSFLQDVNRPSNEAVLGGKLEVKKAIAPWGRLWGNPTVGLSFSEREGRADTLRAAVSFGDNFRERWSWALNGSYTHGFADVRMNNVEVTGGAMYTIEDSKLAVGLEAVAQWQEFYGAGLNEDGVALYVGPSVQWRPTVFNRTINVNAAFLPLGVRGNDHVYHNRFAVGVSYAF